MVLNILTERLRQQERVEAVYMYSTQSGQTFSPVGTH